VDDLLARYAITLPATDGDIAAQVKAVRAYWNKVYTSPTSFGQVAKLCRAEDERLKAEHGAKMETRAWWQARQSDAQQAAEGSIAGMADDLRRRSLDIYCRAAEHAASRGLILADTKFEWGRLADGTVLLIDEVLTPDSSRFWPADLYLPGTRPPSFDKQYVRDWLESTGWDKNSPAPALPADVIERTRAKYIEAYERLTGRQLASH